MEIIDIARQRLAARYNQTYHKNAIMNGEWDRGRLIKEEYSALAAQVPETVEEEGNDE